MSGSSTTSDLEKAGLEKEHGHAHLNDYNEDLKEASEPPFTVHDEIERSPIDGEDGGSLTKVQSEKPSVNDIRSVPNGGGKAWLQVISSFFVFFNTWGIINAVSSAPTLLIPSTATNIYAVVRHLPNILRTWHPARLKSQRHQLDRVYRSISPHGGWLHSRTNL